MGGGTINRYVSQVAFATFYYPFSKVRTFVEDLHGVARENRLLRQSLVEASRTVSSLQEMKKENERFRSVLGFEPPTEFILLPAKIISVSGDHQPTIAVINVGSNDSVVINQPVINQDGLVGFVASTTPDFATVQLLTHPASRVAARVADSREMGIAKYSAPGRMVLDNLPIQSPVEIGDLIVSSGLGGIYPAGLELATVNRVVRIEEEPFCRIDLLPTVNFDSIEELFILKEIKP